MHTDYQAVARQLEWLAEGAPESDRFEDLKALARNVRMLGVMIRLLQDVRRRRAPAPMRAPLPFSPVESMLRAVPLVPGQPSL